MASKSKVQKAVKVLLFEAGADKVVAKSDGTFEAKKYYFYRHSKTAEGWGKTIANRVPALSVTATRDHFSLSSDSYFIATVVVPDAPEVPCAPLHDLLDAAHSPEMQDDPEGVFAAWRRDVPGAQAAAPSLLDALHGRMEEVAFADVATYNAAINAFWALRAAMTVAE